MDVADSAGLVDAVASRVLQRLGDPPALQTLGIASQLGPVAGSAGAGQLHARLRVAGVELTQSVQHEDAAGGGYGHENEVPLVALKTLVARAYPVVQPGLFDDRLTGTRVTGELLISVGDRVVYRTGPTWANGVRVGPQRALSRGLWDQELSLPMPVGPERIGAALVHVNTALNFVVPAYYCRSGRVAISVRLWSLDGSSAGSADWWSYAMFVPVRAPRLALLRVSWTDANGNTTSPSDAAMLGSLSLAARMLPFPYFATTVLSATISSTAPFGAMASSPGACNNAWDKLVADLALTGIFTALFQLGDIVCGFVPTAALPTGPPGTQYVAGCGRGAIGAFVNDPTTMAHELGHLYQRAHVAVPNDPSNDPLYPRYGGDPRSIGEVGIDTGIWPPTLYDPDSSDDIMSYGSSRWISPYTYRAILDARFLHQSEAARPGAVGRPLVVVAVRLLRNRTVELRKVIRVDAPGQVPRRWEGATSPLSVDVLDGNGTVLLTHHLLHTAPRGCGGCGGASSGGCGGCGGPLPPGREPWQDFEEALEWPEGASSLAFHDGGDPLLVVSAGESPNVELSSPERQEGTVRMRVVAGHPRETPTVLVLFTGDDGRTWWPVAVDPDGEIVADERSLPSRGGCRFRVVATAELQPTVVDSEPFDLPPSGMRAYLDLPDSTCRIAPGPVQLRAMVDLHGHDEPGPHDLRWRSNLEGDLGTGAELLATLGPGTHEITFSAPDGLGSTFAERGIIIVSG